MVHVNSSIMSTIRPSLYIVACRIFVGADVLLAIVIGYLKLWLQTTDARISSVVVFILL